MERFPLYNQNEVMDCGPACLRMISNESHKYYMEVSLNKEIREK